MTTEEPKWWTDMKLDNPKGLPKPVYSQISELDIIYIYRPDLYEQTPVEHEMDGKTYKCLSTQEYYKANIVPVEYRRNPMNTADIINRIEPIIKRFKTSIEYKGPEHRLLMDEFNNPANFVVKYKLASDKATRPTKSKVGDAGWDIYAARDYTLMAGETALIETDVIMAIELGWAFILKDRSSMGLKVIGVRGGVIDSNYRKTIGVILSNDNQVNHTIKAGDRIAQGLFVQVPNIAWLQTDDLDETDRKGGFGSSGR